MSRLLTARTLSVGQADAILYNSEANSAIATVLPDIREHDEHENAIRGDSQNPCAVCGRREKRDVVSRYNLGVFVNHMTVIPAFRAAPG